MSKERGGKMNIYIYIYMYLYIYTASSRFLMPIGSSYEIIYNWTKQGSK